MALINKNCKLFAQKNERTASIIENCKSFAQKLDNNDLKKEWRILFNNCAAIGNFYEINRYLINLENARKNDPDIEDLAFWARHITIGRLCEIITQFCPNGEKLFHEIVEEICQNQSQQLSQTGKGEKEFMKSMSESEKEDVMEMIKENKLFAQTFNNNDLKEEWLRLVDNHALISKYGIFEINEDFAAIIKDARKNDIRAVAISSSYMKPDRLCWVVKKFCPNGEKLIHEIFEGICKEYSKAPQTTEQGMER